MRRESLTRRTFTVLVHVPSADQRRLFQGVEADSPEGLLGAIEMRMGQGTRISYANIFNAHVNAYQPLRAQNFAHLPSSIEMEIGLDSRPQVHQGPFGVAERVGRPESGTGELSLGLNRNSYKRQIVDCVRSLLLPTYNRRQINSEEMAEACSVILHRFCAERGVSESALQSHVRDVNLGESDVLRRLSSQYIEEHGFDRREYGAADTAAPARKQTPLNRTASSTSPALHTAARAEHRRATTPKQRQLKTPPRANRAPFGSSSPRWSSADGRYDEPSFDDSNGFYARNAAAWDRKRHQGSSPSRQHGGSADAVAEDIVSVSYTVAGTLPVVDNSMSLEGLRVALSSPAVTSSDDDVVVTASVVHVGPATLCWWLAYGPSRLVLNLDKLYRNGLVTTFQVSETGVVLSIRGGTLVPGWTYQIHLDVAEVNSGRHASAQIEFLVPGPSPVRRAYFPPEIGSTAQRDVYMKNKQAATQLWRGVGYVADSEPGTFSGQVMVEDRTSTASEGRSMPLRPPTDEISDGGTRHNPPPHTSGAGAPPSIDAASSPTRPGASINASEYPSGSATTFQNSLKEFFVGQIEPLYHLSANPSLSEAEFKGIVRNVAASYWFAHPAKAVLTDAIKRAIVSDVKVALAKARGAVSVGGGR